MVTRILQGDTHLSHTSISYITWQHIHHTSHANISHITCQHTTHHMPVQHTSHDGISHITCQYIRQYMNQALPWETGHTRLFGKKRYPGLWNATKTTGHPTIIAESNVRCDME